jgi:hypothetical protein
MSETIPHPQRELSCEEQKIAGIIAKNLVVGRITYQKVEGISHIDDVMFEQFEIDTLDDYWAFRNEVERQRSELEGGCRLTDFFLDDDADIYKPNK